MSGARAGKFTESMAVPDGLNSISVPPWEDSRNGAWYSPPASLRSVLSAKTITASPGSSRWLGKVKVLVECSVRAST